MKAMKTPKRKIRKTWNRGKTVGQRKPLTPKQVRMIKDGLSSHGSKRDLALFSLAIDTMLRSSDLLNLKVADVMTASGVIKAEIILRQKKTGEGNLVGMSAYTQARLSEWIEESDKYQDDHLFTGLRKSKHERIQTLQYRRLVKQWVQTYLHIDVDDFSTHSLRRTKAALIFEKTGNVEVVKELLGHKSITSTSAYLNIGKRKALEIAREVEI